VDLISFINPNNMKEMEAWVYGLWVAKFANTSDIQSEIED
jgi:hypothetical protein